MQSKSIQRHAAVWAHSNIGHELANSMSAKVRYCCSVHMPWWIFPSVFVSFCVNHLHCESSSGVFLFAVSVFAAHLQYRIIKKLTCWPCSSFCAHADHLSYADHLAHACMLHSVRWGDPVKHYSALATIRVGGEARFILLLWWKVLWVRAARICRRPAVHFNCTMDPGHHSLVADSWIGCDGRGIKQKGSAETCSWCSCSCFHSYPCCACNRFWSYSTPEQQELLWQTVPCSCISWSPLLMKYMV